MIDIREWMGGDGRALAAASRWAGDQKKNGHRNRKQILGFLLLPGTCRDTAVPLCQRLRAGETGKGEGVMTVAFCCSRCKMLGTRPMENFCSIKG